MKKSKKLLIAGLIFVVVILGIIFTFSIQYINMSNNLNNTKIAVDTQWAQVENVMQRRADLIPNLTRTVKGSMKHEEKVFGEIANARKMFNNAKTPNGKLKANEELNNKTNILINAIHENYPTLASNQNVKNLMTELSGSENRIAVERKRYIEDVSYYNQKVANFPTSMVASMKGMHPITKFKASSEGEKTPVVDLED